MRATRWPNGSLAAPTVMLGWQEHPGRSRTPGGSNRRTCGNSTKRCMMPRNSEGWAWSTLLPSSTTVTQFCLGTSDDISMCRSLDPYWAKCTSPSTASSTSGSALPAACISEMRARRTFGGRSPGIIAWRSVRQRVGGRVHPRGTVDPAREDGEVGFQNLVGGPGGLHGHAVGDDRPACGGVADSRHLGGDCLRPLGNGSLQQEGVKVLVAAGSLPGSRAPEYRQHLPLSGHRQPHALPVSVHHHLVRPALDDLFGEDEAFVR